MTYARAQREPLVRPGEIDHQVADMSATISADVTLQRVQAKLAESDQWLPIDGDPAWTVGRLVDTNSTGPLRLGFGAWRDLLLGAQFTNGKGELITAGGRTMKNVAGYDLTKFMVGQGSIFGKLATVTTRAYKRPTGAVIAKFDTDTRLVNRLMPTELKPQWMILTPSELWCGYLGDERTSDWYTERLPELAPRSVERRTIDQDIAQRQELWKTGNDRTFRAALPPAKVKDFVSTLSSARWAADPAFGVVVGQWDQKQPIRDAARRLSGVVTFFENDAIDFDPPESSQRLLLERLKKAFDPDGRLAPLPWQNKNS
jgi:FAD/FMN-containing dehydrogenase